MRHYPAYCTDCKRLWLVATAGAPSASPECPRCRDLGRIVPGAYYSDPASTVFNQLEEAVDASRMTPRQLGQLGAELERILPSPTESEIEEAFERMLSKLGLDPDFKVAIGKRVAMRMVVTITSTRSQPVIRESGVMRLPQTIAGLFDKVPASKSDHPIPMLRSVKDSLDDLDEDEDEEPSHDDVGQG
jgi:hypothetical protein